MPKNYKTIKYGNLPWLWLSLLLLLGDQLTKLLAVQFLTLNEPLKIFSFFNINLAYNTGAAFSMFSQADGWQQWFFVGMAVVVSTVIIVWLKRMPRAKSLLAAGLACILSGALGNLWDRLYWGYVVDFIQLYAGHWYWPTFNVADICICVGAGLLILDTFKKPQTVGEK